MREDPANGITHMRRDASVYTNLLRRVKVYYLERFWTRRSRDGNIG